MRPCRALLTESLHDTHMENLCFTEFNTKIHWSAKLAASDAFHMFAQSVPLSYRCLKNVIYQIDNKNEWLLRSVTFTAKLELVFVLKSDSHLFTCFNDSPSKLTKNAFYFILKALFVLKIFAFLSWLFRHAEKTAWIER